MAAGLLSECGVNNSLIVVTEEKVEAGTNGLGTLVSPGSQKTSGKGSVREAGQWGSSPIAGLSKWWRREPLRKKGIASQEE